MTISRGLPLSETAKAVLTESEQEEIRSQEGKWTIPTYGEAGSVSIESAADSINGIDSAVIVGGMAGFQFPILIGFQDGKAKGFYSLGYSYPVIEDSEQTVSRTSASGTSLPGYSYDELLNASKGYKIQQDNGETGGGATITVNPKGDIAAGRIFLILVVITVFFAVIRKGSIDRLGG